MKSHKVEKTLRCGSRLRVYKRADRPRIQGVPKSDLLGYRVF